MTDGMHEVIAVAKARGEPPQSVKTPGVPAKNRKEDLMAFEIFEPRLPTRRSRSRRIIVSLLGLAALSGLIWCCDIAYHYSAIETPTAQH
jgi:hypothetical protein